MRPSIFHSIKTENSNVFIAPVLDYDTLRANVFLDEKDEVRLNNISSLKRKQEWLSVRYWLQQILEVPIQIGYTPFGKPYLVQSPFSIGISHSHDKIALILSETNQVSIDIEKCASRIMKLTHKFVRSDENNTFVGNPELFNTLIWCSKEVLYKQYEIGELDFVEDLRVEITSQIEESGNFVAYNYKQGNKEIVMNYHIYNEYAIVWSIQ